MSLYFDEVFKNYSKILLKSTDIDERQRQTRMSQGPMCKVINANGLAYGRSVEYSGAVGWNGLLPSRRNAESIDSFTKETKKHLKQLLG